MVYRDCIVLMMEIRRSYIPSHVVQSVTCLATDVCLTADRGVTSLITARSHTFMDIMKSFIRSFSSLPLNHSRGDVFIYK